MYRYSILKKIADILKAFKIIKLTLKIYYLRSQTVWWQESGHSSNLEYIMKSNQFFLDVIVNRMTF